MPTPAAAAARAQPKRRWYQFSLRTILVLTTVVCLVLGYHARRSQIEQKIVARAQLLDPKLDVVWQAPGWWPASFDSQVPGILFRVTQLTLTGDQFDIRQLDELQIDQLTSLQKLDLIDTEIWEEDAQVWWSKLGLPMTITLMDYKFGLHDLRGAVEEWTNAPTSAATKKLCRVMLGAGRKRTYFDSLPADLSLGNTNNSNPSEELLSQLLHGKDEELGVLAARTLWHLRSRRHAQEVIQYFEDLQPADEHAALVKSKIMTSLNPQTIRKGLLAREIEWNSWLAALRPHHDFTELLILIVEDGRGTIDTIHALGQSKDPQVVPTLIRALSKPELNVKNIAVRSLIPYRGSALEKQLIAGLKEGNALFILNAAEVLGEICTAETIPDLQRLAEDRRFQRRSPINMQVFVQMMSEKIDARVCQAAEANAA